MATYLHSYGCTTGAGPGADSLFHSLSSGTSHVQHGVCRIPRSNGFEKYTDECVRWLIASAEPFLDRIGRLDERRMGVILASTKGGVEDTLSGSTDRDPIAPVLERFCRRLNLSPLRSVGISNACASSHSALFLARHWIDLGICDSVIVLAVDILGRFIESGFRALQAVTPTICRPFSSDRDGLALGEGAAAVLVSREEAPIRLSGAHIVTEGVSVTRPSSEGIGLSDVFREVAGACDLVIAHATATVANDLVEAKVLWEHFPLAPVTATKWCIGHTLGVSGLIDLIAGAESIRRGKAFPIATTLRLDPVVKNRVLLSGDSTPIPKSVVISSLGFGGVNAAVRIES